MNICDILVEQVKLRPNSPAVYSSSGNFTYAELGGQVATLSAGLVNSGVRHGDVVALRLDDASSHLIAALAVGAIGATVLSVPRSMPDAQRDSLFVKTGCRIILSGEEYAFSSVPPGVTDIQYSDISLTTPNDCLAPIKVGPNHPWVYATGSGSTGKPKILPITHGLLLNQAHFGKTYFHYRDGIGVHSMYGVHFVTGKRHALEILHAGGVNHISRLNIADISAKIKNDTLHVVLATPYHTERILDQMKSHDRPVFQGLEALYVSSATISMSLRERIVEKLTPNINILYGANECWTAAIARPCETQRPHLIGFPCGHVEIEIVDQNDRPLPVNHPGVIRLKADDMLEGYLNDPEATQQAFRDGWFYPGDVGQFLPDGQLLHLGRADNMMIVSGVNLYPAQVENCLRQIDGIREVVVKPLPHKSLQDLPCALVVVEKGFTLETKELLKIVHDEIAGYALHDIEFVERLPFNEQGKITQNTFVEIFQKKWERTSRNNAPGQARGPGAAHGQEFGSIKLKVPEGANAKMLAAWVKALGTDLPPLTSREADNRLKSPNYAWAFAVLELVVAFAQALRIPIFERFDVVGFNGVSDSKNVFSVTFRLPAQDLVPADLFERMLKTAGTVASWTLGKSPDNQGQLQQFFKIVQDNVRAPFSNKMSRGKSTFPILRTAHKMGIPYFHLPNGVYQLGLGGNARRIHRSTTDRDSTLGAAWSKNKLLTNSVLRQAGMPVPQQALAPTLEHAKGAAQRIGYPVVVKPADLERGEGVSVDVGQEQIGAAFELAQKLSPANQVLVEQQIAGVCHRLFVVGDTLLYAVKRLPIGVYGDGISTVKALVDAECKLQRNLPPWKRSGIRPLDELAQTTLTANNFAAETIPEAGTFVGLRRIETTAWGGVDEDVTHSIHPENVKLAVQAAKLCGLDVAGVDLISKDVTEPWFTNGAAINELNFAPLLGGGDISKKHIGAYLERILVKQGRIPTHVCDESLNPAKQARNHWNELRSTGLNAFLVSGAEVLDGDAHKQYLCAPDLEARVRALVLRKDVQGIVVVAENTEQAMRLKKMLGTVETA